MVRISDQMAPLEGPVKNEDAHYQPKVSYDVVAWSKSWPKMVLTEREPPILTALGVSDRGRLAHAPGNTHP